MPPYRSSVEPVLGTRLTMRVDSTDPTVARAAEERALATADRLEGLLSAYRADSPYSVWRRGQLQRPPAEVVAVLDLAARWHASTAGAFNPYLGAVTGRWARAADEQRVPDRVELAALASAAMRPYVAHNQGVEVTGDCSVVDVHGVAKGWVVDRMVEAAMSVPGVDAVLVDLGGDLRHAARDADADADADAPAAVAIEDPFAVADNAAPLTVVRLSRAALATSGGGRRGWWIGGEWFGHVIDPATGWPVTHRRSASVVAASTVEADVLASAFTVLDADAAESLATRDGIAVLTVSERGEVWRSPAWRDGVVELDPMRERASRPRAVGR